MTSLHRGMEARFNEYPIISILGSLGILPNTPNGTLIGAIEAPVLDLGCGRNAKLVEHLRHSGVEAEGIDPEVLEGLAAQPHLMKRDAREIPRPDDYYASAVTHMGPFQDGMFYFSLIHMAVTGVPQRGLLETYQDCMKPDVMPLFEEVRRVVRPAGRFVVYPAPTVFLRDMEDEFRQGGYQIQIEDIPPFVQVGFPESMREEKFEYLKRLTIIMPD